MPLVADWIRAVLDDRLGHFADEGSVNTTAYLERAARFEYEAMGKIAA